MNPTNEQELDEILTKLENAVALNIGSQGMRGEAPKRSHWKAKAAIQAHTNAEIARTLDRIASKKNIYVKHAEYVTELNEPPLVITTDYKYMIDLGALQAERAKLKEVK